LSFEVVSTTPITGTRPGRPDYSGETYRGKNIWGYALEHGEDFEMVIIIATTAPGAYNFTRAGINPGETVELINPTTGLTGFRMEAGWDYLVKELWIGFNQPMRFQIFQDVVGDVSCDCTLPPYDGNIVKGFPIAWARSQIEPWDIASNTFVRVTNMGSRLSYGKCWLVAFKMQEEYTWF